jgi:hypothetical protein
MSLKSNEVVETAGWCTSNEGSARAEESDESQDDGSAKPGGPELLELRCGTTVLQLQRSHLQKLHNLYETSAASRSLQPKSSLGVTQTGPPTTTEAPAAATASSSLKQEGKKRPRSREERGETGSSGGSMGIPKRQDTTPSLEKNTGPDVSRQPSRGDDDDTLGLSSSSSASSSSSSSLLGTTNSDFLRCVFVLLLRYKSLGGGL